MFPFVAKSFEIFNSLPSYEKYILAFSGGKDSHALLAVYNHWMSETNNSLDVACVFSDTKLETRAILKLVRNAFSYAESLGIDTHITTPEINKSFWVTLIGYGYPVPDYRNRWCTKNLKITPMNSFNCITLTGSHYGESIKRDNRLNSCGSTECGVDLLGEKSKIEPIKYWKNCDVWDYLFYADGKYLPEGTINNLLEIYKQNDDLDSGSLRMGCSICPVVKVERIQAQVNVNTVPHEILEVRYLLEGLRKAPRIFSQKRSKKTGDLILGAILIDARIEIWAKLQKHIPFLLKQEWITRQEIRRINYLLSIRSYPITYKTDWIKIQEQSLKENRLENESQSK